VIKAKAAVDAVGSCKNKVSCADILAMATRDVIALVGSLILILIEYSILINFFIILSTCVCNLD
jgi:hypothetical protein